MFDVFLCHNSEDKPAVREIGQRFATEGIKPWLDVEQIRPGTTWQTVLGEQIKSIRSAAVFVGNGGIGPWQNEEIQAFLNEFIDRKCPVIPTILASAKTTPELPWTLKNRHRVDFRLVDPDPLKQLVWGITGQKRAGREPLVPGKEEKGASKRILQERLYPPLLKPPDPEQATQLEILRRRVKEYWVDGVLEHSLYNEVLISLGKRQMPKAVDAPWKYTVEVSDGVSSGSLEDRDVSAIYGPTGLLLILGEPGSGKTTTLLDLARTLLDRSEKDIRDRVPVVLNLSSWKKQPLVEWMSGELSEKYRVPRKIGRSWVQQDYLLPLLDGLDEVPTTLQPDCVAAINTFVEESNPSGFVVCCRLNEYRWLPERLKLNGAICLEPLSEAEVDEYLASCGSKLAVLRDAVNRDSVLRELAQTPLMLSVMSLAFRGVDVGELARQKGKTLEEGRKQIFRLYIEQMFQRKGTSSLAFPKEKTMGWLSWLAGKMREHSQSVFLVEGLQPNWLATRAERSAYTTTLALFLGPLKGLFGRLFFAALYGIPLGLASGVLIAVGTGLRIKLDTSLDKRIRKLYRRVDDAILGRASGNDSELGLTSRIVPLEAISWRWGQFWKSAFFGFVAGVTMGSLLPPKMTGLPPISLSLLIGLPLGLIWGLIGGVTERVVAARGSPNQGIKLSLRNSSIVFFVISSITGLILALIGLKGWFHGRIALVVILCLMCAVLGVMGGLSRGGKAVLQHFALRLALWQKQQIPLNVVGLLDYCAKLILLKKVGGGYIFIHRMLLEYFADLPAQVESRSLEVHRSRATEPGNVASVGN